MQMVADKRSANGNGEGFWYSVDTRVLAKAIFILDDIRRNYGPELERVFCNTYVRASDGLKLKGDRGK